MVKVFIVDPKILTGISDKDRETAIVICCSIDCHSQFKADFYVPVSFCLDKLLNCFKEFPLEVIRANINTFSIPVDASIVLERIPSVGNLTIICLIDIYHY